MEVGDVFKIEIDAIDSEGKGVAKKDGRILLIEGSVNEGDVIDIRIDRVLEKVAFCTFVDKVGHDEYLHD